MLLKSKILPPSSYAYDGKLRFYRPFRLDGQKIIVLRSKVLKAAALLSSEATD